MTRTPGFVLALVLLATAAGAADSARPLSFTQAVQLASGQGLGVALAALKLGEANAKIAQNRGALLPSVTGQASMVDRTFNLNALGFSFPTAPGAPPIDPLIGPVYDSEARLHASQAVIDLAAWQKIRAARYGALGARADGGVAAEASAYAAALAYLRAARAEAVVGAREEDLRLASELQAQAEAQLAAGTSPNIDVTRARTQTVAARGALLVARNQQDRARLDLARAIGVDPSSSITLANPLDPDLGLSDAPADSAQLVPFALEHRDELRGEAARLGRARADRSAIAAERLPRVDVSGDWGRSGEHFGDALNTYAYAVAVTLPLVDGLRREGRIKEQADLVRESEVRGRDLRDQVVADARAALLDLDSGIEQRAVAADRVRLAIDELSQARERFSSGVAGNIEVINAQSSLVRAHDAEIDARFAVASARASLARAAGVARTMHGAEGGH